MEKKRNLFEKKEVRAKFDNIFDKELYVEKHTTTSGNGSVKLDTSGDPFVDDFANIGRYKNPRTIDAVFETADRLWNFDPLTFLKETFYIRLITRKPVYENVTYGTHRGQGLRNEFILRMYWVAKNHPKTFVKNISLIPTVGSFDDLFEIMRTDLIYNGKNPTFNWAPIIVTIVNALGHEDTSELVKKYLPTIRCASKCHTVQQQANNIIGKKIARFISKSDNKATAYANYRRIKSSGTAHTWQKLISEKRFNEIDFNLVAGRALSSLVKPRTTITRNENGMLRKVKGDGTNFIQRHNLVDKFTKWLDTQKTAKFTGFVYELFKSLHLEGGYHFGCFSYQFKQPDLLQKKLINKQFKQLIETAKNGMNTHSNFIVAMDISGSMTAQCPGTNVSAYQVALSMALYYSHLLEGKFSKTFLTFANECKIAKFKGDTPVDEFCSYESEDFGSTNFLGVARRFAELKGKGYEEKDFPTGVIAISDGEFNRCGNTSSYKAFKDILRRAGFSEEFVDNFKIVLWDIPNNHYGNRTTPHFEELADCPGMFHIAGFDPAGIAFLMGTEYHPQVPKTTAELFTAAMDQEILNLLRV
jgi:hypothetical protein